MSENFDRTEHGAHNGAAMAAKPFAGMPMADVSLAEPGDYIKLLKPRVMSLVVFTALAGMCWRPARSIPSLPLPH